MDGWMNGWRDGGREDDAASQGILENLIFVVLFFFFLS